MAASSSAPATALTAALAALERAGATARERESYAPKLRGWLHELVDAARPVAPPRPELRGGNKELNAARDAAHKAAKQHRHSGKLKRESSALHFRGTVRLSPREQFTEP